jgi:hypothetical protein
VEKILRWRRREDAPLGVLAQAEAQWLDCLHKWIRAEVAIAKNDNLPCTFWSQRDSLLRCFLHNDACAAVQISVSFRWAVWIFITSMSRQPTESSQPFSVRALTFSCALSGVLSIRSLSESCTPAINQSVRPQRVVWPAECNALMRRHWDVVAMMAMSNSG